MDSHRSHRRLLRLHHVVHLTGLSRATIYRLMTEKKFPKQIMLTERSVGWDEDAIQNWIVAKLEGRSFSI